MSFLNKATHQAYISSMSSVKRLEELIQKEKNNLLHAGPHMLNLTMSEKKSTRNAIKNAQKLLKEYKTHARELKKHM